jgi:hypothetical protein
VVFRYRRQPSLTKHSVPVVSEIVVVEGVNTVPTERN